LQAVPPYSKLAYIYDRLMDHVNYKAWCQYVLELIQHTGKHVETLVDLACGTGSMLLEFRRDISNLIGCDQSQAMIHMAGKKLYHQGIQLIQNNISEIALTAQVTDSAILMYDSLNYILNEDILEKTLTEINRILKRQGIFIFDVVSENHCIEYYSDYLESEYWNEDGYSRYSYYDPVNKVQSNEFRIVLSGKTYMEIHFQRIYSVDYLKSILNENNFEILGLYCDFKNNNASGEAGRIHFVSMKR
jgi:ubiquinone/menaquinone biosynthesis C-methylase UbiE